MGVPPMIRSLFLEPTTGETPVGLMGETPMLRSQKKGKPNAARCSKSKVWNLVLGICLGFGIWNLGFPSPAGAQVANVSSQQVANAIQRGVTWVQARQLPDGSWPDNSQWRGGHTALALLALLNAGVDPHSPEMQAGMARLLETANESTYVVSLKCMVLAAADPAKYRAELTAAAQWLMRTQLENGTWNYSASVRGQDNSNTQFALMGLHEAAKAGVNIDPVVWQRSQKHFRETQLTDGGWTYRNSGPARGSAYGSMTCAGIASLFITGEQILVGRERGYIDGAAYQCGRYVENLEVLGGLGWLARRFDVRTNPQHGTWLHYYLYTLERVGMTGGLRYIGPHDWYRQGARYLVETQVNGCWNDLQDTCFSLLFLAKGLRPVLIQKLQWSGSWNLDRYDAAHLVEYISQKRHQPVAWQSVPLGAPVEDWLTAPILYVQGHEFPRFTDEDVDKLRRFVDNGGVLVFEACCSKVAFAQGFRTLAARAWPDSPPRALGLDHPIFHAAVDLDRTHGIMGIDAGCKTCVFFLPNDLSCVWEQRELQAPKGLATFAFDFGLNLAAYATGGGPLGDRLTRVELAPSRPAGAPRPATQRGVVQIARLIHDGDYNCDSKALANLADLAARVAAIDIVSREEPLDVADEAIFDHPVLIMTGHYAFQMTDPQIDNLARHLSRGGVLIAEACCGQPAFDASFRRLASALVAKMDGATDLAPLPADHPLFSGKVTEPIGTVRLRPALATALDRQTLPSPVILAATVKGRAAILYSPYDWTCGFERDKPYACRGYVEEDAVRLGLALLLFAVSY